MTNNVKFYYKCRKSSGGNVMKTVLLGTMSLLYLIIPTQKISADDSEFESFYSTGNTEYFYSAESFVNNCGCKKDESAQCNFDSCIKLNSISFNGAVLDFNKKCKETIFMPAKNCYCIGTHRDGYGIAHTIISPVTHSCQVDNAILATKGIDELGQRYLNLLFNDKNFTCHDGK